MRLPELPQDSDGRAVNATAESGNAGVPPDIGTIRETAAIALGQVHARRNAP
ncbi:hypothetical protein [Streptomyces sp. NPDC007205]|uniref:hypothetical protein n=1 Tax=Streptomyces sp. NPDC007205 TaxID=3154316 RepID=UPI0034042F81